MRRRKRRFIYDMNVKNNKYPLGSRKRRGEGEDFIVSKKYKREVSSSREEDDEIVSGIRDLYVDDDTLPGMRTFFKRLDDNAKLFSECNIERYMSRDVFELHSEMILEFLRSYGNVVSVVGPPGCGKTHMIFDICRKFFVRCGFVPNIIAQSQKLVENINDKMDERIMSLEEEEGEEKEEEKEEDDRRDRERFLPRANTCCSFLGIRRHLVQDLDKDAMTFLAAYERYWKRELDASSEITAHLPRVASAKMIIIDEQSLIGGRFMYIMDYICRRWKKTDKLFGNVPVVVLGDPCQLVPVNGISSYLSRPFVEGAFNYPSVTRIIRCKDDPILKNLIMSMREDREVPEPLLKRVNYSCVIGVDLDDPQVCRGNLRIFCKNVTMNRYLESLTKIYLNDQRSKTFPVSFCWKRHGQVVRDGSNRSMTDEEKAFFTEVKKRVTEELRVKMDVMIKTNVYNQYINGERGVVEDFVEDGVVFRNHKNRKKVVRMAEKELSLTRKEKFCVSYMPLHQCNAVTAHTCQGQTGDFAITEECMKMNAIPSFAGGTYVCISRATSMGSREDKLRSVTNGERKVEGLLMASRLGKKSPVSDVYFTYKEFFEESKRVFLPKHMNPIHVHFFLNRKGRSASTKYAKDELDEIAVAMKNQTV